MIRKSVLGASFALLAASAAIFAGPALAAPSAKEVLTHYSALAEAKFQDSLTTAKALDAAQSKGLIARDGGHVRPTERGFDFLSDLQELFLAD